GEGEREEGCRQGRQLPHAGRAAAAGVARGGAVARRGVVNWAEFLAAIEQQLALTEAGLAADIVAPVTFAPPADLGPLPDEYVEWAAALVDHTASVEAAAAALAADVGRQLAEVRRQPPLVAPRRPALFDAT